MFGKRHDRFLDISHKEKAFEKVGPPIAKICNLHGYKLLIQKI